MHNHQAHAIACLFSLYIQAYVHIWLSCSTCSAICPRSWMHKDVSLNGNATSRQTTRYAAAWQIFFCKLRCCATGFSQGCTTHAPGAMLGSCMLYGTSDARTSTQLLFCQADHLHQRACCHPAKKVDIQPSWTSRTDIWAQHIYNLKVCVDFSIILAASILLAEPSHDAQGQIVMKAFSPTQWPHLNNWPPVLFRSWGCCSCVPLSLN